jgi:hypothetical protein
MDRRIVMTRDFYSKCVNYEPISIYRADRVCTKVQVLLLLLLLLQRYVGMTAISHCYSLIVEPVHVPCVRYVEYLQQLIVPIVVVVQILQQHVHLVIYDQVTISLLHEPFYDARISIDLHGTPQLALD